MSIKSDPNQKCRVTLIIEGSVGIPNGQEGEAGLLGLTFVKSSRTLTLGQDDLVSASTHKRLMGLIELPWEDLVDSYLKGRSRAKQLHHPELKQQERKSL